MKKSFIILVSLMMAVLLFASCSGSGSTSYGSDSLRSMVEPPPYILSESESGGNAAPNAPQAGSDQSIPSSGSGSTGVVPVTAQGDTTAEKIIYTVDANIETIEYDDTVQMVYDLLETNGAFIEIANVGGRNYLQTHLGTQTFREARFSLRVPRDRLNAVTASLDHLGNVTLLRSNAENISAQFFDTQSRLNSLRTQEERLLDMLSKAEDVPEMLSIEDRLADVRYRIESLTTSLRNWQNQVDYSTLNLFIIEVQKYTEPIVMDEEIVELTYWQQIGEGIQNSAKAVARVFTGLFKWFVINLPILGVLAVIALIIILIIRRQMKRSKESGKKTRENSPYTYPGSQYMQYPQAAQYPQAGQNQQAVQNPQVSQGSQDSQGTQE